MTQRIPEEIARAWAKAYFDDRGGQRHRDQEELLTVHITAAIRADRWASDAALRSAVEAEREACAKVAEEIDPIFSATNRVLDEVAEAIRARGKA